MATEVRSGVLVAALARRGFAWAPDWRAFLAGALAREVEERRFFLWIPVAAMAGVALNFAADREPVLWLPALLTALFAALAWASRARPLARGLLIGAAALCAGFLSTGLRIARVETPMLDHIRIVKLQGFVEEVDFRAVGARLVIAVVDHGDMPADLAPRRIRVTTRKAPGVAAGDYVALQARLLPPSRAVLPGGYDFARDAYFAGVGAVGSTLGAISVLPPPTDATWRQRVGAAIDHARNRLALRVDAIIGGDEGAIAAAMVTGKRDFLSNDAKDLIREAGIFHIITISGVQMTLVAGIFFVVARRLLALSPTLALRYPIKKWAAGAAMLGSFAYDLATGSRVGTERALIMTLIVLGAVMLDRRALTMRNLALAVLAIVALEPEAILGVSFQLSFAAVAALVAVMEARQARGEAGRDPFLPQRGRPPRRGALFVHLIDKPRALLFATFCATSATASFMAYHFHDLSPYVLIGNPLTLTVIELFAVPGALVGTALYPLGLDAPVWLYVGAGIRFILWAARIIAAAPGSTLHLAPSRRSRCRSSALRFSARRCGEPGSSAPWRSRSPRSESSARRAALITTRSSRRRAISRPCATPTEDCRSSASDSTPSTSSNGSPPTATAAIRRRRAIPTRLAIAPAASPLCLRGSRSASCSTAPPSRKIAPAPKWWSVR